MFKSLISRGAIAAAFAATMAFANPAAAVPVDVELQLLVDVSGSVDGGEYTLQMDGIGNAFKSAAVQNAIANGTNGAIAVQVIQWSSSAVVSIDWTTVTAANASTFGDDVIALARAGGIGTLTGIGNAINFGAPLFTDNGYEGDRLVMDVSGDGSQNTGSSVTAARDNAVAGSATQDAVDVINGLPILNDEANLDVYYTNNVVGGDDPFVLPVSNFGDIQTGMVTKLVAEITGEPPQVSEPAVIGLLGMGVLGVALMRRRTA